MSMVELERPSPAATAGRHAVPARLRSLRGGGPACGEEPFDDLAIVFPSRRPCGTVATALTRRGTTPFDALASATAWLISEGLEALDPARRRSVVRRWREARDYSPPLVGDGGCDVRLGRTAVGPTERAALLAWLPIAHRDLALYEGGLFEDAPAHAIALLMRPPAIWSLDEALRAERLFPRGRRFDPRRFAAIERHAYGQMAVEHESRLREATARAAAQLPVDALPTASASVAAGCALVSADAGRARAVVARLLARYASSALVAAAARAAG